MREDVLSKRYAEALIESSGDLDGIKKTVAEAKALRKALNDVPELAGFLKHPQIAASVKSEVMSRALSGHFSVVFHNFVKLLIDKARAEILQDTLDYVIRRYSYAGTQVVLLNTSVPLDEALISDIKGSVEKKIKKKVELFVGLDPNLLGGLELIIGSTVIDCSIKGKLGRLKKRLKTVSVVDHGNKI